MRRRRLALRTAAAAAALALALAGCGEREAATRTAAAPARGAPAAPAGRPHLVLVVIDTLRADHVGCYGYERDTTPHIDALAAGGLRFARAIAPSSWTLPSLVTLMTGRHPDPVHLSMQAPDGGGGFAALAPQASTVAELLAAHGYRTAAVGTNPYQIQSVFQVMQGFQSLEVQVSAKADWVVDRAIARLDAARDGAPLFLYLHFMDAHTPYDPPAPFDRMFLDEDARSRPPAEGGPDWREAERRKAIALYDAGIRFVDHELGRLVEALEARGLRSDTVLVVTADHGEAFGDHAELERRLGLRAAGSRHWGEGHGQSLFPELLHVPLVIHGRGVPQSVEIGQQVRLIDLPATLLALGGVPAIGGRGRDLLRFAQERERQPLHAVTETGAGGVPLRGLVTPERTLLDVGGDPLLLREGPDGTMRDATAREPAAAAELDAELGRLAEVVPRAPAVTKQIEGVDALKAQLRRLGYVR